MDRELFEPRIIGFFCNWCSYRAADGAGTARVKYSPNVRVIRVMCSGRVDPTFVLSAMALGADGVLIAGCHPGECHYIEQNHKTMRRFEMLKQMLKSMGVSERRVRLVWASAAEASRLAETIDEMVKDVRTLGPLHWSKNWPGRNDYLDEMEKILREHVAAMEVAAPAQAPAGACR
jgi:F420-non-reducing hydrogenase iron-sulfur subunit